MRVSPVRSALLLTLAFALPLAGCSTTGNKKKGGDSNRYVARDVDTLYNAAKDQLDKRNYKAAGAIFDEVERQHPYSIWARRAELMSAFSYYLAHSYPESIQASQRFLSIHPGNRDAPYAMYLIAVDYYEQIGDVDRDQKISQQALDAMGDLTRRYPDSKYAADARLKVDLINDHLAGKEMTIGRFYQRRHDWLASVIRFRRVADNYQTTSHTPEALERLVESYLELGVLDEARRTAAVLGANYPGSDYYKRAYELIQKRANKA
ncbi:outer membrane protein assembly factor BamD [Sphingomonas nostoxanthinifaciens]|uniref:outer membrane protein assembly factor BamD n=1 Tax=Sphingomonas nostoxanthinifaciens TaxID=2872652 RepID=UPI001CC219E4|nr:outer membrane protein assembly factor BamD [Sphingomonas nostoxanthinifaciens]UAK24602.1 outer membrane protein assembly factor BamD [Sphingomonas nostoxanthinifaciens]